MLFRSVVTAEARRSFERAVALDGKQFKARFYLGMAHEQDGRKDDAAKTWQTLIAESPVGAPWVPAVQQALARIGAPVPDVPRAPGPSAADVAAAAQMSDADRGEMIKGMVAGLAARLAQDGSDIDGWLRLMRAYMVLDEPDKASAATADARKALASDADKLRRIDELAAQLGIKG